jgi:hypothetical protein
MDVTHAVLDLEGHPITMGDKEEVLTVRSVCVRALTTLLPEDQKLAGDEKFRRGLLAERIHSSDEIELKAEEIALLKKLIGQLFSAVVILRIWRILDPAEGGAD